MAYLTRSEYLDYISTLVSATPAPMTTVEEQLIDTLLLQAQAFIELKTGRSFEAVTQTRLFLSTAQVYHDPKLLMLDSEVLTVSSLINGNGDTIAADQYLLWPLNAPRKYGIRLKSNTSWNFGSDDAVSVTGAWGYMATADPLIKRLTARVARHMEQTRSATGTVTIFGDGVRTFEASLPADVRDQIANLTRRVGNH